MLRQQTINCVTLFQPLMTSMIQHLRVDKGPLVVAQIGAGPESRAAAEMIDEMGDQCSVIATDIDSMAYRRFLKQLPKQTNGSENVYQQGNVQYKIAPPSHLHCFDDASADRYFSWHIYQDFREKKTMLK